MASRSNTPSSSRWSLASGPMTPLSKIDPVDILHIPRHRRLQTAGVAIWSSLMPLCLSLFLFLCSLPPLWPIIILYMTWVFLWDDAPNSGGRPSPWIRRWRFWTWFAGYYPAS
ncbi:diacylglycerol O-acyltransferase 1 [Tulasnella sp. JGI-2019a]|nr:diacylglycerol O-acyltransferase 1 [Tulasnella sp. JGI-2019a]